MPELKIVRDDDTHAEVKHRAESILYGLIANQGEMQRIRKEARGRLHGQDPTSADVLRLAGRIAYEEAFFLAQGIALPAPI